MLSGAVQGHPYLPDCRKHAVDKGFCRNWLLYIWGNGSRAKPQPAEVSGRRVTISSNLCRWHENTAIVLFSPFRRFWHVREMNRLPDFPAEFWTAGFFAQNRIPPHLPNAKEYGRPPLFW